MPDTIASLATRQFKLTFIGGMALTPLIGLVVALSMYHPWSTYWSDDAPPVIKFGSQVIGLTGLLLLTGALPALLAGWLRQAPMRWLFKQTLAKLRSLTLAMAGTLLPFESTVLITTLLRCWATKMDFIPLWNVCTVFSLPWLLAALWATQRVLRRQAH